MEAGTAITLGVSLKLYLDVPRTVRWAQQVGELARGHAAVRDGSVRLFVLPSLPALEATRQALEGTGVRVGAQDLFWEDRGAFTGAVSGADLHQAGASYVEVGHAERRAVFGEDDAVIARKLAAAVRNRLTPVLCVGEGERADPAVAAEVCLAQLDAAMAGVDTVEELVLAYEPVWAIGAAEPAPADYVGEIAGIIRERLARDGRVEASALIYGGSAKPGLLTRLGDGVDGLFLGRFAHDPAQLAQVIDEAATLR